LPHIDLYKWAADRKTWIPLDWKTTPQEEFQFLKLLALKQFYVRGTPAQESARFTEALKESMKYIPGPGLSDKTATILHIAGSIFICVLVTVVPKIAKL
jgi:hypothetical protein